MRANTLVYISGPMTAKDGHSIEMNVMKGLEIYLFLLRSDIPAFCPHLCGIFPSAWSDLSHQQWIEYDKAIIDRCTHMLMMDRWTSSRGAVMELEYAEKIGIPVLFSMNDLLRLLEVNP